jgi:hypothetical protein
VRYLADHDTSRSPATPAPLGGDVAVSGPAAAADCCGPQALFPLPADTALKRRVDRLLPRSGLRLILFFVVVVALLNVGPILPTWLDLVAVGVASLAAGGWCAVNFWRCRHAHCLVTGAGWLALAGFAFVEVGVGRSLIHGDEGLVFLGVLGAGLMVEGVWYAVRGTNAISPRSA